MNGFWFYFPFFLHSVQAFLESHRNWTGTPHPHSQVTLKLILCVTDEFGKRASLAVRNDMKQYFSINIYWEWRRRITKSHILKAKMKDDYMAKTSWFWHFIKNHIKQLQGSQKLFPSPPGKLQGKCFWARAVERSGYISCSSNPFFPPELSLSTHWQPVFSDGEECTNTSSWTPTHFLLYLCSRGTRLHTNTQTNTTRKH